jgi:hypothetical protein
MPLGVLGNRVRLASQQDLDFILSPYSHNFFLGVTLDKAAGRTGIGRVPPGTLLSRQTAAPGRYSVFCLSGVISNPTNTTNATVDITNAASFFKVGDVCTFWRSATDVFSSETKTISSISGNTITFSGVWTTAPVAGDLLVLKDGTERSEEVVVVTDYVDFTDTGTQVVQVLYRGVVRADLINRFTLFGETLIDTSRCQRISFNQPTIL